MDGFICLAILSSLVQVSGTYVNPALFQDFPESNWWQNVAMDIAYAYMPAFSANLVCMGSDCFSAESIQRVRRAVTIWESSDANTTFSGGNGAWDMFVVFLFYDNAISDFIDNHETSSEPLYLFVLPLNSSLDHVSAVFESCYRRYVLRVVAIVPKLLTTDNGTELQSMWTYTFNPYVNEASCSDTTPLLIFRWNQTEDLMSVIRRVPDRSVTDMKGCRIHVAARNSETNLVLVSAEAPGNWTLQGPWAPVFAAILQGMNAQLELRKANEEDFPDEHQEEDEMFFGRFSSSEKRYIHFDFPSSTRAQCYTYCMARSSTSDPVWFLLVGEYTWEVWLLIVVTMIVVAAVYKPMARWYNRSLGFILFYFFAAVNSSMYPNPIWNSARIIFVLWSMFFLIMSTAYQAILQGFRTIPSALDTIKDVQGLLDSDLIIRGPPALIKVVEDIFGSANDSEGYNSRLLPYADGDDIDEEALDNRYAHICSSVEFITLNDRKGRYPDGKLPYFKMQNHCVLTQPERLVLLPKHSPFLKLVSQTILRLTQGGLIAHVMNVPEPTDRANVGVKALGLPRITSPLTLLGVGLSLAAIVFIAEIRGSLSWT